MIVRTLIKSAVILGLLLIGFSYAAYLKTGRFVMPSFIKAPKLSVPDIPVPRALSLSVDTDKPAYKWRDQTGSWQYTSEPPAKGVPFTKVDPVQTTEID